MSSFDKLLNLLIDIRQEESNFSIYNAEVITNGITSEVVKKNSFAGFKTVQIGYEAVNDDILKRINKKNTLSSNILLVKWAKQFNIKVIGVNILTGLIGETDKEIIDSIKNLHFLRFYLDRNMFQHYMSDLVISSASPYYKYIADNHLIDRWNYYKLSELLPEKYFNRNDRFKIFYYSKDVTNPLWKDFEKQETHYLDNSYYYQIIKKDSSSLIYKEFYNSLLVNQLEIEILSLHWKILCHCNHKVSSKQEMIELFDADSIEIENIIKELFDEYLVYANNDFSEIVSLINTDLICQ